MHDHPSHRHDATHSHDEHEHHHDHGQHAHSHDSHAHHGHSHHHFHGPARFSFAFAISTTLNLSFVIAEVIYALIAHSTSLLADAGHNFGDVLGLLMAWWANWLLGRNPSEKYSYGYKKMTIISALTNALILVATSAIIVYEAISKLLYPVDVNEQIVMVVAFIGIFINGGTALLFLRHNEDLNIKAAYVHLLSDAGIAAGVVVAGAIIYFTNWGWIDPVAGILIVAIILWGTWGLLRHSIDLLLGAVPKGIDQNAVRSYLAGLTGVVAVHDLHIWGLSTQDNALTAHLIMPDTALDDADYQKIREELQQKFNINHITLQVEKGRSDDPCGQTKTC